MSYGAMNTARARNFQSQITCEIFWFLKYLKFPKFKKLSNFENFYMLQYRSKIIKRRSGTIFQVQSLQLFEYLLNFFWLFWANIEGYKTFQNSTFLRIFWIFEICLKTYLSKLDIIGWPPPRFWDGFEGGGRLILYRQNYKL